MIDHLCAYKHFADKYNKLAMNIRKALTDRFGSLLA
jgi:hypothetical protein